MTAADLTPAERAAARAYRAAEKARLAQINADSPPSVMVLPVLRNYRHECARRGGQSTSVLLKEVYRLSPCGRFAFIYREGRCGCGFTARCLPARARLVLASERPPLGR